MYDMVMGNKKLKKGEIADTVRILSEPFHTIWLHQHFNETAVAFAYSRLRTRSLACSKDDLQLFKWNPQDFPLCFPSVGEYNYTATHLNRRTAQRWSVCQWKICTKRRRPFYQLHLELRFQFIQYCSYSLD